MKDFDWTSFTRKIAIKAPMSELYDAWTKPDGLEKWFLSKAHYTRSDGTIVGIHESISPTDKYQWSWHTWDIIEEGAVIGTNGKDQMSFSFAGTCSVEIKLEQLSAEVMVTLTQSDIPTDDLSKKDIRLGCFEGWSFYMTNLKSVYEGGLDLRNMNDDLKGVINS